LTFNGSFKVKINRKQSLMTKPVTLLPFIPTLLALTLAGCGQGMDPQKQENRKHMDTSAKKEITYQTGHALVNGLDMYYEIHGTGRPLVLIHGGGSTIYTTFGRVLPMFAKNRQVIAVELQAHGHTGDRDSPESFEQDADDVAELLKQLNISKADLCGFSNGGSAALQVAIRHPARVNKVVAISAMYKRSGMQDWFWGFMEKGTFKDMPQVYKDEYLKITGDEKRLLNMYQKDSQRMLTFKDWKDESIRSIKAPVFVIVGDQDVVRTEHAMEMVHLLAHGRLAVLTGNHGSFIGEIMTPDNGSRIPALTVAMIEEFLDEPAAK